MAPCRPLVRIWARTAHALDDDFAVSPGDHTIRVSKLGYSEHNDTFTAESDGEVELLCRPSDMELRSDPDRPMPKPTSMPTSSGWSGTIRALTDRPVPRCPRSTSCCSPSSSACSVALRPKRGRWASIAHARQKSGEMAAGIAACACHH